MALIYRSLLDLGSADVETLNLVDTSLEAVGCPPLSSSDGEVTSQTTAATLRSSSDERTHLTEVTVRLGGPPARRTTILEMRTAEQRLALLEEEMTDVVGGFSETPELSGLALAIIGVSSASRESLPRPGSESEHRSSSSELERGTPLLRWMTCLPDVLVVGDADTRLLRTRTSGMAFVRRLPLPVAAPLVGQPISEGSVVVLDADGATRLVLPRTVSRLDPNAAARRVHREVLTCVVEQPLPREVLAAARRVRVVAGGQRDWIEEAERLLEEVERLRQENLLLRRAQDDAFVDAAEAVAELDDKRRRVRYLERVLRNEYLFVGEPAEDEDQSPDILSFSEIFDYASELLPNLWIRPETRRDALTLDERPERLFWSRQAWIALQALNDYAQAKAEGAVDGDFFSFCSNAPTGWQTLPPNQVAMHESESTRQRASTRRARTFAVPESVSSDGELVMDAHIKVAPRGTDVPRLHFYDDTRGPTEKVLVGYLGPHLPLASS